MIRRVAANKYTLRSSLAFSIAGYNLEFEYELRAARNVSLDTVPTAVRLIINEIK